MLFLLSENIKSSAADGIGGHSKVYVFTFKKDDQRTNRVAYRTQIHEKGWR